LKEGRTEGRKKDDDDDDDDDDEQKFKFSYLSGAEF
jgi:hypothetical protein